MQRADGDSVGVVAIKQYTIEAVMQSFRYQKFYCFRPSIVIHLV